MTAFRYRAAAASGRIVRGALSATSEAGAAAALEARGLAPLALEPDGPGLRWSRPSRRDLAIAFRSLAALVEAGAPLAGALAATERLPQHPELRAALAEARRLLHEGRSLGSALGASPDVVPPVCLGVLRAGERAGRLGAALEQVATQLEQDAELASRIRQALAYPLVLAASGVASIAVIALVIVPRFAALLADLGQELPPATRLLLTLSSLTQRFGAGLLAACGLGLAALVAWRRTPAGRERWDELLLDLPVVGPLRHRLAAARFCRAFGSLLTAGVPLLGALEGGADASGDSALSARLMRARTRIAEGAPVAESLDTERVLPVAPLQLLAVGESSAQLGPMAARAADLAAADAERALRALVSLLEPALVLLFGAIVTFVAAALLQAAYSLRPGG